MPPSRDAVGDPDSSGTEKKIGMERQQQRNLPCKPRLHPHPRCTPHHTLSAKMLSARFVVVALLVCSLSSASAFPWLFAARAPCTAHPMKAAGKHAAPVKDPTTTFTVTDAKGAPVKAACPGATYTVTVKYSAPRLALVTTTVGTLDAGKLDLGRCPNRALNARSKTSGGRSATITTSWAVPCSATGSATVMSTSAAGAMSPLWQNMASVPIASAAGCKSTCKSAAKSG